MLFQLHGPLSINDLKRAFDEVRITLSEQEVTLVSEVHMAMTAWVNDEQLHLLNDEGQHRSIFVEPHPAGNLWHTTSDGKFRLISPIPPKRTVTYLPDGRD